MHAIVQLQFIHTQNALINFELVQIFMGVFASRVVTSSPLASIFMQLLFSFYKIAEGTRVKKTLMRILPSQFSSTSFLTKRFHFFDDDYYFK
jgi:hypothetical protein